MEFKRYRIYAVLVFLFSSFVFSQDITEQPFIRMNFLDKASFSVYCALSLVLEPNERVKCSSENMLPPSPRPLIKKQQLVPKPVVDQTIPNSIDTTQNQSFDNSSISPNNNITPDEQNFKQNNVIPDTAVKLPDLPETTTSIRNPVLEELRIKIEQNTKDISDLKLRTNALEQRQSGQTIIKYIQGTRGPMGPAGKDGVTTIIHATSSYIYYSTSTDSIEVKKDILSENKIYTKELCIESICINKSNLQKVIDYFK